MEQLERHSCRREGPCRMAACNPGRCCGLVRRAAADDAVSEPAALAAFCEASWWSVYAIVRGSGYQSADAEDLTQGYFARFVEKGHMRELREWRGCVRPYLRVSVRHFLANERDRRQAAKRGGGRPHVSLDTDDAPLVGPVDTLTPEELLRRRQSREAVERALGRLRDEMERAGQGERLARLMGRLRGEPESFGPIARDWGVGRSAVRVALHRVRRRLAALLREEEPAFARPMPS